MTGAVGATMLAGCNDEEAPGDDVGNDDTDVGDDNDDDEGDTDPEDDGLADEDVDDEEDEDDDDDDVGDEENPRLEDVIAWEDSYEMDFDFEEGSGNAVFHEGDVYWTWTVDGETIEVYHIGDDYYTVMGDECIIQPMDTPEDEVYDPEEDDEEYYAEGTTTIDGEEVYEFHVDGGILYVSVDTGYPVRFEGDDGGVVTFHSWGETESISPPDMECVEPGEEGG